MLEKDGQLIGEFNDSQDEQAFAALVERHVNLVFATALRQLGDRGIAEEVTQNVFIALAQSAGKLGRHPTIAGWLHQTTLNKSRERLRSELRRQRREQIAVNLEKVRSEGDSVWASVVPLLDEALLELREADRLAIIMHFMEGQTFGEVGATLGVGEDAVRKRVHRCLDQLTGFFRRRGFAVPALAFGAPLFVLSSQAAPVGLSASVVTAGVGATHAAASGSTLTLIKGALNVMAWTKAKTAIVVGVAAVLATGTTTIVVKKIESSRADAIFEQIWANRDSRTMNALIHAPPALIVRPTRYPDKDGGFWTDARIDHGFWVNASVPMLVGFAYHLPTFRMVLPDDLPGGGFDFMATLPKGENDAALKRELRKQFGLVAHTETREADVFRLQVKDSGKLKSYLSAGGQPSAYGTGDNKGQKYILKHQMLKDVAGRLEAYFGKPVVEPGDLAGHYDFTFQWAHDLKREALRQLLRDQLVLFGLELVPSREPIEVLVVEKVKN